MYFRHTHLDMYFLSKLFLIPTQHNKRCVKSAHTRSFSGPNAGKYGPKKLRIRTLFTQ